MATLKDKEDIERAMKEVREHPLQCCWVGGISISYIHLVNRYIAVFDCDLTIVFDEVGYSSNTIYFYRKGDEHPVAHITHKGLHEPTESTTPVLDRCRELRKEGVSNESICRDREMRG